MKWFFLALIPLLLISCRTISTSVETTTFTAETAGSQPFSEQPTPTREAEEYPGKSIDEVFPIVFESSFADGDAARGTHQADVRGFTLEYKDFRPLGLKKNGKSLFKLRTAHHAGYWSILAGVSHLRGRKHSEIYIIATGPGAVCCTNYWIVDIDGPRPREILRTEAFGSFREPIEIFDDDHDGTWELAHFDTCFRYFGDDCGTCTPEPRVTFAYDKNSRRYFPKAHVMQDFARQGLEREISGLEEQRLKLKKDNDVGVRIEKEKNALDAFDQLIHIGDESRAWQVFNKYGAPNRTDLKEIRLRLSQCAFYDYIRRSKR